MALRVVIEKNSPEVPDDFLFSVLSSTLGVNEEEFQKLKREDGSVSIYVKDPSAILKLQQISEKHSSLLKITFEDSSSGGGIFSLTNTAVKSNWGLAVSWGAVVVLLSLLSMVPIVGLFVSIVSSAFYYAFLLLMSHRFKETELSPESVRSVMKELSLGEAFSRYMGSGFGFWLGFIVLSILSMVLFFALAFVFGGLGAISDIASYGRVGGSTLGAVFVVVFLVLIFWLWLFYVLPLMVSRAILRGKPSFESTFMAVVSIFTPSFVKESFSNNYIGIGGMWSLVLTVGIIGFTLAIVLIITIPVAILILYWLQIYLSLSAVSYIKRL